MTATVCGTGGSCICPSHSIANILVGFVGCCCCLLVLALVVLGFGILVLTMLVAIHSYVIVSGVTTWESLSRRRISYLKDLTPSASPFDQGCLKNTWWFFVLSYRNPTDWKQVYNGPPPVRSV
eukprot:m.300137 g.300137  ORF g.300137 m.300137 type:complete len:123 (+) comp15874_c0_seq37:1750-2118(+)